MRRSRSRRMAMRARSTSAGPPTGRGRAGRRPHGAPTPPARRCAGALADSARRRAAGDDAGELRARPAGIAGAGLARAALAARRRRRLARRRLSLALELVESPLHRGHALVEHLKTAHALLEIV